LGVHDGFAVGRRQSHNFLRAERLLIERNRRGAPSVTTMCGVSVGNPSGIGLAMTVVLVFAGISSNRKVGRWLFRLQAPWWDASTDWNARPWSIPRRFIPEGALKKI
jgi:hypothetical protein